ncbi:RusA family crossover junction endodeoxyribonuclease [Pedobacter cryoconitis]|uniref:RusA family crossover junction endodeoxyribonuclease n=1 Tax=Pedobacter cryoconitis TaxID=188932 RepID=UPI0016114FC2|nr:RusA family crossover junction endodeoxyribonuclease [Pedobacter cryoconitis]MBB5645913.1 Holliday junction resolvase RusA-like endonuclease [Pedobacter cryoconitis]
MGSKIVTLKKVPNLDWAVALWGGKPVPTKQEKYKPLVGYQGIMQDGETEKIFDDLYIRNPDKDIVQEFEKKLGNFLRENITDEMPYKMPVEVILAFTINKKRFFDVDVDNLCKTVLDAMKGIVFDDDSQVVRLLALKDTHPFDTNGISIGVNKLEDVSKGWFNKVHLFYMDEKET